MLEAQNLARLQAGARSMRFAVLLADTQHHCASHIRCNPCIVQEVSRLRRHAYGPLLAHVADAVYICMHGYRAHSLHAGQNTAFSSRSDCCMQHCASFGRFLP